MANQLFKPMIEFLKKMILLFFPQQQKYFPPHFCALGVYATRIYTHVSTWFLSILHLPIKILFT